VELQAGGGVALLAGVVEELVNNSPVERLVAGDFSERVVVDVLAERAAGIDDVADRALLVGPFRIYCSLLCPNPS
jgi:hypothetical protein